jgi:quinohemoprotein amine dehydrogenase
MSGRSWIAIVALAVSTTARAQTPPAGAGTGAQGAAGAPGAKDDASVGIPIDNEVVKSKCGGCHRSDDKGRMSRISYRRATPENWERTIKRMVTLNHANLDPADARVILKYLSDRLGLAPEEARPIAFDAERRMVEYGYTADKNTADLCSSCHSFARVQSERRTKEEWDLLAAMHRGYYPLVDNQPMNSGPGFRRFGGPPREPDPDGRPPDARQPMERALEHLTKTLPFVTSEWSAWSAAMQPPKLAGRWAIVGTLPGKGAVYGQVTIAPDNSAGSAPDGFTTETRYTVARTGETVTRAGKALVYTGYQWRGRSNAAANADPWREVLFVERDWKQMWGRWFTGAYDETGVDVKLLRLSNDPVVTGTSVTAIRTASTARPVKIFGANLPTNLTAADIGMGQGIKVARIVSARADEISLEVDVAQNAPIGARDISIGGTVKPAALVVFDKVDGLRVLPQAGMARVGGNVFPKQLQQFEAVGINNGPDGKPDTADDLNLGIVDVKWSVEEYPATWGDDDVQWVGTLDQNGLFTPNVDGPNPKRAGNRNNVGDVWVVAEATSTDVRDTTRPLRARAHLLVTVPLYMAWFQGGGSQ